jgi:isopenicillin N synthase-like dioxygenase
MTTELFSTTDLVPTIDLAAVFSHDASTRAVALADLDEACSTIGFFQIVNHGVPSRCLDGVLEALDAFFALAPEQKQACRPPRPSVNRGYAPVGSESLAYSLGREAPPDLFEAFNVGPENVPDPSLYQDADETVFAPNIWPDSPAFFRDSVSDYFVEVCALAHRLTTAFALALGLAGEFFSSRTDHSTDMMRMNHYALQPGVSALPGQLGMGPHTDYGIVTVLYGDRMRGLQVVGPDNAWHDVIPAPGALLVNLGDLLAQWTNDRWRSTVHQVLPPERSGSAAVRRRSIAFFHDGNYDAIVECLPTCVSSERPAKYAPVRAGEHLKAKLLGPRTMTRSDAASTLGSRLGD